MWHLPSNFTQKNNLKRHIKLVHEGKTFKCGNCPSSFTQKSYLKTQIESAHGRKVIQMWPLSIKFYTKSYLKIHIKSVHVEKKSNSIFVLQVLHKKATWKSTLNQFMQEKSFKCDVWSLKFTDRVAWQHISNFKVRIIDSKCPHLCSAYLVGIG